MDRSRRRLAPGDGQRVPAEGLPELRHLVDATAFTMGELLLGDHCTEPFERARLVTGAGMHGPHREVSGVEVVAVEVLFDRCDLAGIAAEHDQPGTTCGGLSGDLGGDRFGVALVDPLGSSLMAGLVAAHVTMRLHVVALDRPEPTDDRVVDAVQVGPEVVDQRCQRRRPAGELVDRGEQGRESPTCAMGVAE